MLDNDGGLTAAEKELPVSFLAKLRNAQAETAQPVDPWRLRLEGVRGTTGFDGLERISTQMLMDLLEVPQRQRNAGSYLHSATLDE